MVRQGLQPLTLPDSYYTRSAVVEPGRPPLRGALEADCCVVGAGFAGLTTALELARRGRRVCVLEAQRVAWGASGRNGGFVAPGYAADLAHVAARIGATAASDLHRLSIEGTQLVAANIVQLAIHDAQRTDGILSVARHESTARLAAQRDRLQREFDYRIELLSRAQVQQWLQSARYFQALYDPNAFHIHPLNYARALAREIERLGGRIFEGSGAEAIETGDGATTLITSQGRVRCAHLVIACGGYTDHLVPELKRSYLPIATYVMLTQAQPALIGNAIRTSAAIGDRRRTGDYYRLVDGGSRILWGGRITTRTSEPRRLALMLRRNMISIYPQLEGLGVELAWSGLMAYARHLMPQIGRLRDGIWYCTAFGGHGLNTTAIGGRLIAEAITGQSDRYRLFAPFGLAWNGGLAGRAAVQATYWSLRAMDFLREHSPA
ncbi:MAG TPA: FAD-dependent oxidoreductase [Steroidobacteraceae bacterium]|jgi:glycine/D-amino acid oxidase-like deaminating enzyme